MISQVAFHPFLHLSYIECFFCTPQVARVRIMGTGIAAGTVPPSVSRRPCQHFRLQALDVNGAVAPSIDKRWYCTGPQCLCLDWGEAVSGQ